MCALLVPALAWAADTPSREPQAFLPENVFEFQTVVEGRQVAHGFVIQNKGDADLLIHDIKSG